MPNISELVRQENEQTAMVASMVQAMGKGREIAQALAVGSEFLGAMPAAKAAGYAQETAEYKGFIHGYIDVIKARFPHGVPTIQGRIVEG